MKNIKLDFAKLIPPPPNMATILLTTYDGDNKVSTGTGFFYEYKGKFYIVTAAHNLTGRNNSDLSMLSATALSTPNYLFAHVNIIFKDNIRKLISKQTIVKNFKIEINKSEEFSRYLIHPIHGLRIDVALIPINIEEKFLVIERDGAGKYEPMRSSVNSNYSTDVISIQQCKRSKDHISQQRLFNTIHPSDEVSILGYPIGISDYSLEPVWKRANIASFLHMDWDHQPKFLVDCANIEGMPGSPVVYFIRNNRVQEMDNNTSESSLSSILCGIYTGCAVYSKPLSKSHPFGEPPIGVVWKSSVIDEIIIGKKYSINSNRINPINDEHSDDSGFQSTLSRDRITGLYPWKQNISSH